jgi:hypothetical protein
MSYSKRIMCRFEISESQSAKIAKWHKKIKKKHGEYGLITYSFTQLGMGVGLEVYSHIAKKKKDFTEYDLW